MDQQYQALHLKVGLRTAPSMPSAYPVNFQQAPKLRGQNLSRCVQPCSATCTACDGFQRALSSYLARCQMSNLPHVPQLRDRLFPGCLPQGCSFGRCLWCGPGLSWSVIMLGQPPNPWPGRAVFGCISPSHQGGSAKVHQWRHCLSLGTRQAFCC